MEVSANRVKPKFNPVEVKLTFETKDEFEMFKTLMGYNVTAVDAIYPEHSSNFEKRKTMVNVMRTIFDKCILLED